MVDREATPGSTPLTCLVEGTGDPRQLAELGSYRAWGGEEFDLHVTEFRVPLALDGVEATVIILEGDDRAFESQPVVLEVTSPHYELFLETPVPHRRENVYSSGNPATHVHPEALSIVRSMTGPILDFGCGSGAMVRAIRSLGTEIHGLEIDRKSIRASLLPDVWDHVTLYDGMLPLPFESEAFRSVVATEVLEHLADPSEVVSELQRVAADSIFVTVPDASAIPALYQHSVVPWHMLESTHLQFFSPRALRGLFGAEFECVHEYRMESVLVNGTRTFTSVGCLFRRK